MSPSDFAGLTPAEQWHLHAFFVPSKFWPDEDLLAHRRQITKEQPALPHQAGKAWAVMKHRVPTGRVWPLVNPEIDTAKLARAFIRLAQELSLDDDQADAA